MFLASPLPHDSARGSQSQVNRSSLYACLCLYRRPTLLRACLHPNCLPAYTEKCHRRIVTHVLSMHPSLLQSNNAAPREPLAL
jgi:hypothetical protein